jgi:hypothetical protein
MNRETLRRLALIPAAVAASTGGVAHAALDAAVTTAMTDANTDVKALAALVFGIVIVIAVYKWFRRAV